MDLRAEFRTAPGSPVIADCSSANGRITISEDGLSATVLSLAVDPSRVAWLPIAPTGIVVDLMAYDSGFTPIHTNGLRQSFTVIPGVTTDGPGLGDSVVPRAGQGVGPVIASLQARIAQKPDRSDAIAYALIFG